MNKTKIEWTDFTWNPVTGCLYGCWYCYAKRMFARFKKSFEPKFYPERLNEPFFLKKPSKIFCCSVSDLFAEWTQVEWRERIFEIIRQNPQHIFQLLTKQPERIDINYEFPKNVWLGVTVTTQNEVGKIDYLKKLNAHIKFVSFEPLLDWVRPDLKGMDWIIIGKLTGSRKIKLQEEWVDSLIACSRKLQIPIFLKNNLNWKERIQEFPVEARCKKCT